MFKWIRKCINEVIELDDASMGKCKEEFTVDIAKANYQKYLEDLIKQQEEYKLELRDEIKKWSRRGYTSVSTKRMYGNDFITKDYLNDLKYYFESKGFTTRFVIYGNEDGYLKISWGEE